MRRYRIHHNRAEQSYSILDNQTGLRVEGPFESYGQARYFLSVYDQEGAKNAPTFEPQAESGDLFAEVS